MNLERAAMQGQLAEARSRKYALLARAEGLCSAIRSLLNTILNEVEQIEVAQADQLMDDLMGVMAEIYSINGSIQRLERELK